MTGQAAVPMENPFWRGMFRPGRAVDADTMRSLTVLHHLCGQLTASVAQVTVERDRVDDLFALFDEIARGAAGEIGARGDAWDGLATSHLWDLTRLYALTTLDYAWAASRVAGQLATGQPVAPLAKWSNDERHPGVGWLTTDLGTRLYPLQLLAPSSRLGPWHTEQVSDLNAFLTDAHRRMLDAVGRVLEAHPDDLRTDRLEGERLLSDDRATYDPRQADLHTRGRGAARLRQRMRPRRGPARRHQRPRR